MRLDITISIENLPEGFHEQAEQDVLALIGEALCAKGLHVDSIVTNDGEPVPAVAIIRANQLMTTYRLGRVLGEGHRCSIRTRDTV